MPAPKRAMRRTSTRSATPRSPRRKLSRRINRLTPKIGRGTFNPKTGEPIRRLLRRTPGLVRRK